MTVGNITQIAIFMGWVVLSYFAVGYAVDHSIMTAGRAAALSLAGFFALQIATRKLSGSK